MQQLEHGNLEVGPLMSSFFRSTALTYSPGRQWFARYFNAAVAIPSLEFDELCSYASQNNVILSVGIIEKDGGTLYCVSVLIDRNGKLLSKHRKVAAAPSAPRVEGDRTGLTRVS